MVARVAMVKLAVRAVPAVQDRTRAVTAVRVERAVTAGPVAEAPGGTVAGRWALR